MLRFKKLLKLTLWFAYGLFVFWSYVGFLSHFTKMPSWAVDAGWWIRLKIGDSPEYSGVYMELVRATVHLTVIAATIALACLLIKHRLPPEKSAVVLGKLYKYGMWFTAVFVVSMLLYAIYFFLTMSHII
jgi:hypothetical protein